MGTGNDRQSINWKIIQDRLASYAILVSLFIFAPWWVTLCIAGALTFFLPMYFEVVLVAISFEVLFATPDVPYFVMPYMLPILAFFLYVLVEFQIKKLLRL